VKFDTWWNRWGEGFIFISTGLGLVVLYAAIYLLLRSGRLQLWAAKILSRGSWPSPVVGTAGFEPATPCSQISAL
jgi:hypothetical protein